MKAVPGVVSCSRELNSATVNKSGIALFLFVVFFLSTNVYASSFSSFLTERNNFFFPKGDPNLSSYDGDGHNAFEVFSSFTTSTLYQMNSFDGGSLGRNIQAFNLLEYACYDGMFPAYANQFGVIDNEGNFFSMIDTAGTNPVTEGNFVQAAGQELRFGLLSPEGLFSSVDSENDGNATQIIAKVVDKDGEITIDRTNLGGGTVTFQLFAGDVLLFIEDMKALGNGLESGLVPFTSDYDYNDMVLVIRQSEIPEPATLLLFGSAVAGLGLRRKKSKAA
ncbi:MAG TPA: PEP-CTERM sorting domain-containing protein [Oligoflexia bacterium]|nr:PEP-CTERM sorting domain-containing protein [Oligoflexia bacterium]HMP49041.1 PEP-CTERM sorting domain-containing protein [Oligoflexia bacterium]